MKSSILQLNTHNYRNCYTENTRLSRMGALLEIMLTSELKNVLQASRADLPQGPINATILSFRKRLQTCNKAAIGHFKYMFESMLLTSTSCFFTIKQYRFLIFELISCCSLAKFPNAFRITTVLFVDRESQLKFMHLTDIGLYLDIN